MGNKKNNSKVKIQNSKLQIKSQKFFLLYFFNLFRQLAD